MARRSIEGPGKGQYVSTEKAAAWLGVSEDTYEGLVAAFPWLAPRHVGRRVLWHWFDVVCLGHILDRQGSIELAKNPLSRKKIEGAGEGQRG